MSKFTVKRQIDALISEELEIEAPDATTATRIARSNERILAWQNREIFAFDARRFVSQDSDGNEITDTAVGDF